MTLSEFKTYIKVMVPSASKGRVSDSFMTTLINKAVRYCNNRKTLLRKGFYFDATADKNEYLATDIDSLIIAIGEGGVWYNRGSVASPCYDQLDSVNRPWLDERYPNWVNDSGDNPQYVFWEDGSIWIYPTPSATLTNGYWLPDAVVAPVSMTLGSNYPFTGTNIERPDLEPMDDAIIDYVRYVLKHAVGSDKKGIITRQEFESTLKIATAEVRNRPDYKTSRAWSRRRARR